MDDRLGIKGKDVGTMNEENRHYNLLYEKWIPIFYHDGKLARVGIRKVLKDAGKIRQIAASNPMDRLAIMRFLLALLYWCKGNPPVGEISDGSFPSDWFNKLDENKHCFNLFGDGKRFYQYRKSDSGNGTKLCTNYLVQEVPTGTNFWHFRHSRDKLDGLCPACCAMGLLRLPLFSTSGGRGKPPGVNQKPPIYVVPLGSSLADTLFLSWRKVSKSNLGTPAWEKPDLQLPEAEDIPLLTGLTWLPRQVWLNAPQGPEADCISCGRRERLIRLMVFAGIGSMKDKKKIWKDPNIIYRYRQGTNEVLRALNVVKAPDAATGQWTEIMTGVIRKQQAFNNTWVVGFATVKNDSYLEAMECLISIMPNARLEEITMWKQDKLRDRLRKIIRGSRKSRKDDVRVATSAVASIRPHIEGRVSAMAGKTAVGDENFWEQAAREYSPMMAVIAKSLSPGFTTVAVRRQREIESLLPEMRHKKPSIRKYGRNKGGDR